MSDTDEAIKRAEKHLIKTLDKPDVKAMVWALIAIARAVQSVARGVER